MKVVIQCAAKKRPDAGCMRTEDGRRVLFAAHPSLVESADGCVYAHPDDPRDDGTSWRQHLRAYNENPRGNPLRLLPAYQLYWNEAYRALAGRVGVADLFILSAGWGLLPASFLTPDYDITFSSSAEAAKRRRRKDRFDDFRILDGACDAPIVFFGGKDYFPLFCDLTDHYRGRRVAVYNSDTEPSREGVDCVRFHTTTRTNWHYQGVKAFVAGEFDPLGSA